jgi:hypothetical protein
MRADDRLGGVVKDLYGLNSGGQSFADVRSNGEVASVRGRGEPEARELGAPEKNASARRLIQDTADFPT